MSNEKRLVLCVLLIFVWVMIAPNLFRSLGLLPPPAKKAPAPAQAAADPLKTGKKPGEGNAELKPPVGQTGGGQERGGSGTGRAQDRRKGG